MSLKRNPSVLEADRPSKKQKCGGRKDEECCDLCRLTQDGRYNTIKAFIEWLDGDAQRVVCKEHGNCDKCCAWSQDFQVFTRGAFEASISAIVTGMDSPLSTFETAKFVQRMEDTYWNCCTDCDERVVCIKCSPDASFKHITCRCKGCQCDGFRVYRDAFLKNVFVAGVSPCPLCVLRDDADPGCQSFDHRDFEYTKQNIDGMFRSHSWVSQFDRATKASGCCRRCCIYFSRAEETCDQEDFTAMKARHHRNSDDFRSGCGSLGSTLDLIDLEHYGEPWIECAHCPYQQFFRDIDTSPACYCEEIKFDDPEDQKCPDMCNRESLCLMCREVEHRATLPFAGLAEFMEGARDCPPGKLFDTFNQRLATFDEAVCSKQCSVIICEKNHAFCCHRRCPCETMM